MEYLIDSNILIDYTAERFSDYQIKTLDAIFDAALNTSVIPKIEVLGYSATDTENTYLLHLFQAVNVINLNEYIVERTITIRKEVKIKVPDAIIAATALLYNYTLLTRNTTDFSKVDGLKISNPHDW